MDSVVRLRHDLHRHPDVSGDEARTAAAIARFFRPLEPDSILEGLGGHGVAFVFTGARDGPTVLLRCELDALPINESNDSGYCSTRPGISHKCGHDGHMAIIAAVGQALSLQRPQRGTVVLLYQPAEENGQGARGVVKDSRFAGIKLDYAFALHNLPGFPLGKVIIRSGVSNCASRGMVVRLSGKTAHAAQPKTGKSPSRVVSELIQAFSRMPPGIVPSAENAFATLIGARLGEKAFGTTPGEAEVWATLRSETDDTMESMVQFYEQLTDELALQDGLTTAFEYEDVFNATVNSPSAVDVVKQIVRPDMIYEPDNPFPWSEDFGQFTAQAEGALIGIGAGESVADLHHPDYDFPDELIPPARLVLLRIVKRCLAR